jgi:hypothetical protein
MNNLDIKGMNLNGEAEHQIYAAALRPKSEAWNKKRREVSGERPFPGRNRTSSLYPEAGT